MAKAKTAAEHVGMSMNGVGEDIREEVSHTAGVGKIFTREAFEAMQADLDLSPSLSAGEEDEGHIQLGRPGKSYFIIHPTYEWTWPVTYDVRKSGRDDPFLVAREQWPKFPPSLLRIKRLLLCQKFEDDSLRTFLWLADWYERHESPSELHRSLAKVISKGRAHWGQALYQGGVYVWRRWPETWMGEPPPALWPDRDFYDIVTDAFADRFVNAPDHELIRCIGEE
jgi:hypothetical protein